MNEADENERLISAQVVLKATSTKDSQEKAVGEFARAGFTVGKLYADSFAITAPAHAFESYFKIKIESSPKGGTQVISRGKSASFNLPVKALPANMANQVKAIIFTRPPDFGPGGSF